MTTYSSFPGFVECVAPPGGSIVDRNFFGEIPWPNVKLALVLIYGSLPRPPDKQSTVVCTCSLTLLSTNEESITVDIVDDLAFWRYAHREGELRLDSFKQILEYGIDNGWLVMLLEHPAFKSNTQSLELISKECKEDSLILIIRFCKFTRLSLFIKILVACSVRLLFSVGERFKHEVYPHTFQDVLCVDIVSKRNIYRNSHQVAAVNQLLIWFVIFLPRMKKETSFFSSWLIHNDSDASSRYVTRQGESLPERSVCRLARSLYGLQQASRQWFHKFSSVLLVYGFTQSYADSTLFVKQSEEGFLALLVYMDDILLVSNVDSAVVALKQLLAKEFQIKDLGTMRYFLGFEIARAKSGISVSQRKYTLELVEEFGFLGCKPVPTPMELNLKLSQDDGELLS